MSKFAKFLKNFVKFTFSDSSPYISNQRASSRSVVIDEVNPTRINSSVEKETSDKAVKLRLIIQINWLLMGICILSFVAMIVYIFIYPDRAIPDLIQNAFFTTLGWFGGVLATFFKVEQSS